MKRALMQFLVHKNIKNTLVYLHLAEELFKGEQEYVSKVAKTTADTCALRARISVSHACSCQR